MKKAQTMKPVGYMVLSRDNGLTRYGKGELVAHPRVLWATGPYGYATLFATKEAAQAAIRATVAFAKARRYDWKRSDYVIVRLVAEDATT